MPLPSSRERQSGAPRPGFLPWPRHDRQACLQPVCVPDSTSEVNYLFSPGVQEPRALFLTPNSGAGGSPTLGSLSTRHTRAFPFSIALTWKWETESQL